MTEKEQISFTMNRIITEQFATFADAIPFDNSQIQFGVNFGFNANIAKNELGCKVIIAINNGQMPLVKLDVCCVYAIKPADWEKLKQGDTMIIDKGFLSYLAMQTIGTARGILHAKTEDTAFNIYIIPPINTQDVIKNNLKIELKVAN